MINSLEGGPLATEHPIDPKILQEVQRVLLERELIDADEQDPAWMAEDLQRIHDVLEGVEPDSEPAMLIEEIQRDLEADLEVESLIEELADYIETAD